MNEERINHQKMATLGLMDQAETTFEP